MPVPLAIDGVRQRLSAGVLSRRETLLWAAAALLLNHALHTVRLHSVDDFLLSIASLSLVYYFACYVVIARLVHSDGDAPAGRDDVAAAIACGAALSLSALVGYRVGVGVVATAAAVYLLWWLRRDPQVRAAGTVMLALSVHLVWAPIAFQYFMPELLSADAAAVRALLGLIRPDIAVTDTTFYGPDGHVITLAGACSSFKNVSVAVLAAVAMIMHFRTGWRGSDVAWILGICAAMIAVNVLRLGIMAFDFDSYEFWHNQAGAQLIALFQTAVIAWLSYLAARHRPARDNRPAPA